MAEDIDPSQTNTNEIQLQSLDLDYEDEQARHKSARKSITINYGKMIGSTGLVSKFMIDEQISQRLRQGLRADKTYSSITVLSSKQALLEPLKAKELPSLDARSKLSDQNR